MAIGGVRKTKKVKVRTSFDPTSVVKSTTKAANAALLVQERCQVHHGRTVRDVIASMSEGGSTYRMADLKYDVKVGRLELLKAGSSAGLLPVGRDRKPAPRAGQPVPAANLVEFFEFLQGQLRKEVQVHTGEDVEIQDKGAKSLWPEVDAFVIPNLGLTERWVPYHTILGVHEKFLVEHVHHRPGWNDKQKFKAMFIFRAHCKRDLFTKAQLPLLLTKKFWDDPIKAFAPGGPMEASILKYRKDTGQPLLTSCFRIIPPRVLKDDTENLVRSITNRSQVLLGLADEAYAVSIDPKLSAIDRMNKLSTMVQEGAGLGETWAKMLTVCIDLANPKLKLLETQCDVGTGAATPMKVLLPKGGPADKKQALMALLKIVNADRRAKSFWNLLSKEEAIIRKKFSKFPLICAQANTKHGKMTAATLQVQLCEYRQFRHALARNRYGLADDETMRCDPDKSSRLVPGDFVEMDKKKQVAQFGFPKDGKKIQFEVSNKAAKHPKIALNVATMCFEKMRDGMSKAECEKFRDELLKGFEAGKDVPESSPAWEICRSNVQHSSPLCQFTFEPKKGKAFPFQTTKGAACGMLNAERIARLCWEKMNAGMTRQAAIDYRNKLYKEVNPTGMKLSGLVRKEHEQSAKRRKKQ